MSALFVCLVFLLGPLLLCVFFFCCSVSVPSVIVCLCVSSSRSSSRVSLSSLLCLNDFVFVSSFPLPVCFPYPSSVPFL